MAPERIFVAFDCWQLRIHTFFMFRLWKWLGERWKENEGHRKEDSICLWLWLLHQGMAGLFMDGNGMIRKKKADVFAVKRSKEDMDIKNIMGCAQVQTSCFCSLLHPYGTYELFLDVRSRKLLRKPWRSEAHRCYHSSSRVPFQRQKMPKIRCESERRTMSVGFAETLARWCKSIFVHMLSYQTFDIIRKVSTPCQPTSLCRSAPVTFGECQRRIKQLGQNFTPVLCWSCWAGGISSATKLSASNHHCTKLVGPGQCINFTINTPPKAIDIVCIC